MCFLTLIIHNQSSEPLFINNIRNILDGSKVEFDLKVSKIIKANQKDKI